MTAYGQTNRVHDVPLSLSAGRLLRGESYKVPFVNQANKWCGTPAESCELSQIHGSTAPERINTQSLCRPIRAVIESKLVTETVRKNAAGTTRVGP